MSQPSTHNLTLEEMDKRYFFHPSTSISDHQANGPRIMERSSGVRVTDINGISRIDGAAGLWCVNVGHGRAEIVEAITRQAEKMAFYHSFTAISNEPAIRLAERIIRLAPDGMEKVFFGNSGSDANDTNIKIVYYYNNMRGLPAKKKIISRDRAYHGSSFGSACLTGLPINHEKFDLPLPGFLHTNSVDQYRGKPEGMSEEAFSTFLAEELEAMVLSEGPESCAAFIAEPLMGTGGVLVPPAGYFEKIRAVLDKYDMLLIADEVICGFGRTGNMFGSDTFNIRPDIVTMAKGLSSGYQPISASAIGANVWQVLEETAYTMSGFGHGYTYSAHPVCAAASLANLDILEGENLTENAAVNGAYLKEQLQRELGGLDYIGDIRGKGLMIGIEFVADRASRTPLDPSAKFASRTMLEGYDNGIICRALPHRDVIAMSPPLCITKAEIDEYVAGLGKSIRKVADAVTRDGLMTAA